MCYVSAVLSFASISSAIAIIDSSCCFHHHHLPPSTVTFSNLPNALRRPLYNSSKSNSKSQSQSTPKSKCTIHILTNLTTSFLFALTLLLFFPLTSALVLTVQPLTLTGTPTLVGWALEPSDADTQTLADAAGVFDLRFVQNDADVGLALPGVQTQTQDGQQDGGQSGTVMVTFQQPGNYTLKAVCGPSNTLIGTSNLVEAVNATTVLPTVTVTFTTTLGSATANSDTSASSRTPPPNHNPSSPNIPAIVGGTIGGLLLLALCGVLYVFMSRRRRRMATEARRRTFHRDMMVQRRAGGGGGAGTGLVSQGPGVGGGGAAPTANGNVNVNEEGSRVGDEPRHDIPAPAPPALLPPADPPVPTTRASDLPCVLPALSFWSWTGTGSSSISIAGGNDSSDVDSQSQSISRGLSSANDMERGFAGAGFPGNLGIASGLGLAPGGGTTTDRGIPSINGRAPPLGTGHIVPSPKGPRGPAKHGGAADGDVYTPAQPTPFVSQLPFQSVSSPQLPNSAAAVATPPTSATVALARAQTTTGASGISSSATPKRGRGSSISRAASSRPARLPTALSSLTIPPPSPISSIPPSPSIPITPTVPPNAPPRTQRQAEIAARIDMLSAQMVEVVRAQRDARAGRFDAAREGNRWSMREDGSVVLSPVSPQSGFGPVVSPTGTGVRASVGGATTNTTMTNSETATTTSGSVSNVTMARYDAVLAEMQREMVWLRDTEHSAWAMGLTEVRPPGWARYMTP